MRVLLFDRLVVGPLFVPLITSILCLFFWGKPKLQRGAVLIGFATYTFVSFLLWRRMSVSQFVPSQMGHWPFPFGISWVADPFGSTLVLLSSVVGFLGAYQAKDFVDAKKIPAFYPLFSFLFVGISGAFMTGDLFNLYVWFEVFLLASTVLLSLGESPGQLEGTFKYIVLNLLGSTFFLIGAGFLYNTTGTLNIADVSSLSQTNPGPLISLVTALLALAFLIKAAAFPLFFWLPSSYHTALPPVTAVVGSLLTKIGIYCLVWLLFMIFSNQAIWLSPALLWIGAFTMVTGVLGALSQKNIRRLLCFHIVSQVGYLIAAIGTLTPESLSATVFFLIHIILIKTALLFFSGEIEKRFGTSDLDALGGLTKYPLLSAVFMLSALSLAGVPPFSGFWAKLFVLQALLKSGHFVVAITAIATSLFTLMSMIKIWMEAFWKKPEKAKVLESQPISIRIALPGLVLTLASVLLVIGLGAAIDFSNHCAKTLSNVNNYRETVRSPGRVE